MPKKERHVSLDLDFDYVLKKQEKTRIAFGSSQKRPIGYHCKPANKLAQYIPDILPAVGPGSYDMSNTSAFYQKEHLGKHPPLGGSAPRFKLDKEGAAQEGEPETTGTKLPKKLYRRPRLTKEIKFPFGSRVPRFKEASTVNYPGVGFYETATWTNRRIPFAHSLGGSRKIIPVVQIKCVSINIDECAVCKLQPLGDYGDYWQFANQCLCRDCYKKELESHTVYNKFQLGHFKKIRDCAFMHRHEKTDSKVYLTTSYQVRKLQEKEAYFCLYFCYIC